jgi:PKD repeat protein
MGVDPDGKVVAYEWNMGDGKIFTGELEGNSIPHDYLNYTYSKSGNYTVSFRVKDDKGVWSNWVSRKITVKIPEIASASLSWIGLDNLWMSIGIGAFIVIFASYLAVRDSNRNGFVERANSRKVVVRKDLNRRGQGPRGKYYRDYRTYVRKGSKKSPWD